MESGWTLGIKAVLVFICKLSTLSDATASPPPPSTTSPPVFVLPDRTKPRLPGWTAGSSPSPPSHLFADDFFLTFIIQERLTAHKSRPPLLQCGTSHQRDAGAASAASAGPTCSTLFVFCFFFSFWRSRSQNKTNNLCLSHAVFLTIILFSSPASILLYTRRSR